MQRVRETIPDARLLVATAEKRKVPGAEMILTGGAEALREVLGRDSVIACPRVSWSGYPIKLLNAMAAGKAVVACQSAAYPITPGRDGLVVADDDEEAFASALLRLMKDKDLRSELGRNARATVEARHGPEAYAIAIEEVYQAANGRRHHE